MREGDSARCELESGKNVSLHQVALPLDSGE